MTLGLGVGFSYGNYNPLGAYVVYDNFQRANNSASLGTAPTGQPWQQLNGMWGINDGQAYVSAFSTNDGGNDYAVIDCGLTAYNLGATLTSPTNAGLCFCVANTSNGLFLEFANTALDALTCYSVISGTYAVNSNATISPFVASGTLGVNVTGPTYLLLVNNQVVGSGTVPTSLQGNSLTGLYAGAASPAATFGDFTLTNPYPGYLVYDNFQRAANGSSMGYALTGQPWLYLNGTWGITNNSAYCAVFSNNYLGNDFAVIDCGTTTYTATATISEPQIYGGICFAAQDGNDMCMVQFGNGTFTQVVVMQVVGGTGTTLLGVTIPAFTANDTLGVAVNGTSFSLLVNGASVGTAVMSTALASNTGVGIMVGEGPDGMFFTGFNVFPYA